MRKQIKVKLVLYVFWLFITKFDSTDRQKFEDGDGNFKLTCLKMVKYLPSVSKREQNVRIIPQLWSIST